MAFGSGLAGYSDGDYAATFGVLGAGRADKPCVVATSLGQGRGMVMRHRHVIAKDGRPAWISPRIFSI